METQHIAGKKHGNADGLSRRPFKRCGREEVIDKKESEGTSERASEIEDKLEVYF